MNIFQRAVNWLVKAAKLLPTTSSWQNPLGFLGTRSNQKLLDLYAGWVYACVTAIAEEVATIRFRLYRVNSKNELEEVHQHELLDVLNLVNPYMTKSDLVESYASYMELEGNSYWFLSRENNGKGKVSGIYPLRPDMVAVKVNKDGQIVGYSYDTGTEQFVLSPKEILHIKKFNPKDPYRGIGTLRAALQGVIADVQAETWNNKFFENSARPEVVLEYPTTLKEEDKMRLLGKWEQEHQGAKNVGRTAVLSGGMKMHVLSQTQKDMDFVRQREFSRDQILAIFRVPPILLMMSQDFNRATAEAALESFSRFKIRPLMQKLVDYLNEFLVPEFGEDLMLGFDDPVPENRELRLKENEVGFGRYLTINEIREREGLDPIGDEGNQVLIPLNLIGGGEPTKTVSEHTTKAATKGVMVAPVRKRAVSVEVRLEDITKSALESGLSTLQKEEIGEVFWKGLIGRSERWELVFERQLRKYFKQQEKRVSENVDNLTKAWVSSKAIDPEKVVDSSKEVPILIKQFTPILWDIVKSEGQEALDFIKDDGEFDTTTEAAQKFVEDNVKKFAVSITETSQKKLAEIIGSALEEGLSSDLLAEKINEAFHQFGIVRSNMIARSEVIRSSNQAHVMAWGQTGVVKGKEWFTALDERTCEFCAEMHGKVFDLEEVIFEEGSTMKVGNESLSLDYEDVEHPPLHVNCRCTVLPVLLPIKGQQSSRRKVKESISKQHAVLPQYEIDRIRQEGKEVVVAEAKALREKVEGALGLTDDEQQETEQPESQPGS